MNIQLKELNTALLHVPSHTNQGYPIKYYAIIINDECIGTLECNMYIETRENVSMHKPILYLRQIFIEESRRKQGIGRMLIELFIKRIKNSNINIHSIQLEADNSELFWSKLGFKKTDEISIDNNPRMIYILK